MPHIQSSMFCRIKPFLIAWMVMRSSFEASVWATAAWCVLYAFLRKAEAYSATAEKHGVLWLPLFGVFLAMQFLLTSRQIGCLLNRSEKECQDFMKGDCMFVVGAILLAFITAFTPALGGIVLLYLILPWTGILADWLPWWWFLLSICYMCFRCTAKQTNPADRGSRCG
jgi:hypothetical protein